MNATLLLPLETIPLDDSDVVLNINHITKTLSVKPPGYELTAEDSETILDYLVQRLHGGTYLCMPS